MEPDRSGVPALIEVVLRDRLGLGGIELGGLVEVVGEGFLGGLVCLPAVGPHGSHGELGLGWAPGGVEEWGRSGLTDVEEDLCDGFGGLAQQPGEDGPGRDVADGYDDVGLDRLDLFPKVGQTVVDLCPGGR